MRNTVILLGMLVLGAVAARGNLLTNGGFEDATPSPWVAANGAAVTTSTASASSGSQSGQVDFPDFDDSQIKQDISITPADATNTYTLSFSANVEGYSELLGIRPTVMEWDGVNPADFHFGDIEYIASGTTGWVTFSQNFTMTNPAATLFQVLFYYYPQGGPPKVAGSVLMDDISLEVKDPNLLVNGGFEDATPSPWVAANGAAVSISTASASSGTQSGQVDFPDVDNSQIYQDIAITPADATNTYTLSFSANVEGYSELLGILPTVMEWDGVNPADFHFGDTEWIASGTTGWVTFSQDFTVTNPAATLFQVLFYYYPQGGPPKVAGSVLMDDISLEVRLEDPPPLVNGGFEDATVDPWFTQNGAVVSISTADANSGSQSGQVDFPEWDLSQLIQIITLTPTNTYTLSFSANVEGYPELLGIRPTLMEWDQATPATFLFGDIEWIASGTTGWVTFSQSFTLTDPDATYFQVIFYYYPQGDPKVAGSVLMDDIILGTEVPPFPEIAAPNLLVNGGFTLSTNEVDLNPTQHPGWYTVDGSLSDWGNPGGGTLGFWGKFADLVGWTHYHADPNIPGLHTEIGTTNNPSLAPDGAGFTLDGTDKLNTDFNTTFDGGILNLNSSGGYRNGMVQTLSGVTINPALTYELAVEAGATTGNDHASATFTAAVTLGGGTAATNLANAVPGGLLQIPAATLPSVAGTLQTTQISGADLLAGGPINVLIENLNTEIIPEFPNVDPGNVVGADNVSQVRLYSVSLNLPPPLGDVDKDGFVTGNDVDVANSYLDGSVDGGADAATRQNALIAQGYSAADALAELNLTAFDIDGDDYFDADDVTALEALVPPLLIDSAAIDGSGDFDVDVSGVTPGTTYYLERSADLTTGSFPDVVDSVTPVSGLATMSDTNPPAGQAAYRITD